MKKYYIKDDDDKKYEVIESDINEDIDETSDVTDEDINTLGEDDIIALKRLAAISDQLIALIQRQDEDVEEDETMFDDDDSAETEEVIDTCKDSKRSFGALEKRNTSVDDSLVDEVSDAWAKRFGGK